MTLHVSTREARKTYSKGYNAGSKGQWPEHKPPLPPDNLCRCLMDSLQKLRDAVDGECAKFDPEDEMVKGLDPFVQQADEAMMMVSEWLKDSE